MCALDRKEALIPEIVGGSSLLSSSPPPGDTQDDLLLAQMLQLEYDREHDLQLRAEEKHFNKHSKGNHRGGGGSHTRGMPHRKGRGEEGGILRRGGPHTRGMPHRKGRGEEGGILRRGRAPYQGDRKGRGEGHSL